MISILIPSKNEPKVHYVIELCEAYFPNSQIIVCNDRYGQGKGWAIRKALEYAKGDFIVFIDADGDINPRMIRRLIPFIIDYDIVVGKKEVRGMFSRKVITILSRFVIKVLFGIGVQTQTGVKLFRRDALSTWESDSFAFDIEILHKAKKEGKKIINIPIDADITRKMKLSSIWKTLVDVIKIWRYRK